MSRRVSFSSTIKCQEYDKEKSPKESLSPLIIHPYNFSIGEPNDIMMINRVENWFDGMDIGIAVRNIAFEKKIFARVTNDKWKTYIDYPAKYIFSRETDFFNINIPSVDSHSRIEFAICYQVDGKEYWLNNDEKNFIVSKGLWDL